MAVDPERERISLGIKQLDQDPFNDYVTENDKGAIVTGVVKEVEAKSVTITLSDDVEATMKASEISRDKVEDARNELKVGDSIEVKITNVDRKNRTVAVSVKAKDMADEKEAVKSLKKDADAVSPATIGDLIKAQMESKDK